jgi:hypothetical protein
MKQFIGISILLPLFTLSASAQNPGTGLKEADLKGKVKQATMNIYPSNNENVDTTHLPTKLIQTFNEDGNESLETMIDDYGKQFGKKTYDYTTERTIEIDVYNQKDSLFSKILHKYDRKGLETKRTVTSGNPEVVMKTEYVYDKKGRNIEEDNYKNGSSVGKVIAVYNEYDQRTENDYYDADGNLRQRKKLIRNTLKNTTTEEIYDAKDVLQTRESFFYSIPDKQGNWQRIVHITEGHSKTGKPFVIKSIMKQEFVYFE